MLVDRRQTLRQSVKPYPSVPDNKLFVRPGTYLNSVSGRLNGKPVVKFYDDFFSAYNAAHDFLKIGGTQ